MKAQLVEVWVYSFLTLALDGGGWSVLCPYHFTPGTEPKYTLYKRLEGPKNWSGWVWRRERLLPSL
jgi:hypothetical protein